MLVTCHGTCITVSNGTGYYTEDERRQGYKRKDFKAAKFDFCDEMLTWAGAVAPTRILDVGCGFGGTSRHLAKKFRGAQVEGAPCTFSVPVSTLCSVALPCRTALTAERTPMLPSDPNNAAW